jgi:glutamate racemase
VNSKASKLPATDLNATGVIGVFDSGIGGLSVLQALRAEMPQERFVYWADSGYAPYGERSDAFVIERCHFITQQLLANGPVKAIVVACNTATAVAIEALRAIYPQLPFIGVEPALKPAFAQTQTLRVGVMGTHGTLRSQRFEKLRQAVLAEGAPKTCEFVLQACKGLALAIEQQTEKAFNDTQALTALCANHVHSMGTFGKAAGQIDTLVLGCTHYVFVQDILRELVGPDVNIISTGDAVAKQAQRLMSESVRSAPAYATKGDVQLWTTGSLQALQSAAKRWLDLPAGQCHQVTASGASHSALFTSD